ncbi:MAG: pitrilysin family protein, partial [Proteobacteria bacterium]|nr:pitrilysin family protein [Pseudomonadota bacterium]
MRTSNLMREFFAPLAVVVCAFVATATQALDIQEVTSPGGIKAWLVEEHSVPLIAIEFEFNGGAAADPAGKYGLAYLTSGLLNEGAGDLDALAFQTALEERAIRMGFDSNRDQFSGSMTTLTEEASSAFELLGLALKAPRFDADAVERVREQIYSILRYEAEQGRNIATRAWMRDTFDSHPYGQDPKGTSETITALTAQDLRTYVASTFAKDRLIIGVVGDVTPAQLGVLLDETFAGLSDISSAPALPVAPVGKVAGVTIIDKAIPQSVAVFGLPGLKREDPDWYAATIMNYVLGGGGFSSRLMEEVRRKRGLTYGVYTSLVSMEQAGLILGSVSTVNDRMAESMRVISDEIARMAKDGITPEELADAQAYLTGSYPLTFATSDGIASQLVGVQRHGLGMDYIENRNNLINGVTQDDVRRLAQQLLDPDKLFWVIVGQPVGIDSSDDEESA